MEAVASAQRSLCTSFLGNPSRRCGGVEQNCFSNLLVTSGPLKQHPPPTPTLACRQENAVYPRLTNHCLTTRQGQKALPGKSKRHGRSVACQAVRETTGKASADGLKFAIVVARFNDFITKLLLEGAKETFQRHGAADEDVEIVWVPGSFELPVVATAMAKSGKFDAILCIGAVIRGATTHYEAVVSGATSGILGASAATGVPVIFGVLTCDTMEQAIDRAGGKAGNKGGECAATAVEMAALLRSLREQDMAAPAWH